MQKKKNFVKNVTYDGLALTPRGVDIMAEVLILIALYSIVHDFFFFLGPRKYVNIRTLTLLHGMSFFN